MQATSVTHGDETQLQGKTIRFVCISDTHNRNDIVRDTLIPGDVLIHTGDFSDKGTIQEIQDFNTMLGQAKELYKYKHIVLISGNHDINMDPNFYPNIQQELPTLLSNVTHYLCDSTVEIEGVKIYGSPWTNLVKMAYGTKDMESKWRNIPKDTDILLTHLPPINIRDLTHKNLKVVKAAKPCSLCSELHAGYGHLGCKQLRQHVLERVKPKVHIFGHVHEQYGFSTIDSTLFVNAAQKCPEDNTTYGPIYFDYLVSSESNFSV